MTATMPEPDDGRIEQDPEPGLHPAEATAPDEAHVVFDHDLPDDDGQPEIPADDSDGVDQ